MKTVREKNVRLLVHISLYPSFGITVFNNVLEITI